MSQGTVCSTFPSEEWLLVTVEANIVRLRRAAGAPARIGSVIALLSTGNLERP